MLHTLSAGQSRNVRTSPRLCLEALEGREVPAAFSPGNLVIYRVGDGAAAPSANGAAVFLDEYSPNGTLVQSVAMPTTASGANLQLIAGGTATAEGFLSRSANGAYLVMTGYGRDLGGTTALSGTASSAVPRVIGLVGADGGIDTTTGLNNLPLTGAPRTAVSSNGTDLWIANQNDGAHYATRGSSSSTQLNNTVTTTRHLNIFDGQLYLAANAGSFRLGPVGTGLPMTGGQTIQNIPGIETSGGSPYGFFMADLDGVPGVDTLYVANDDAFALRKYSLVSGTWTLNGVVGVDDDYRGLTGVVTGTTVTLFATRKQSELVSLEDTSGYNGAFAGTPVVRATSGANKFFRGIAPTPVFNAAPVNTVPGSFSGTEDTMVALTGLSVSDADAGTATVQVTLSVPTGSLNVHTSVTNGVTAAQVAANGTGTVVVTAPIAAINTTLAELTGLQFTPAPNAFGDVVLTVTTNDLATYGFPGARSDTDTATITLAGINDAPTLDAIANVTVNEDAPEQTVPLAGISVGPNETQGLTFTATSDNPLVIPNPTVVYTSPNTTGTLKFTPVANIFGTATVTVTVTDDGGTANGGVNTVVRTFAVTVNSVNDAPTLDPIADVTVTEDGGEQTVNLTGVSAVEPPQFISISVTSSNPGLVPDPTVTYTSPNASGALKFTPVANAFGTATITVTVWDDGGTANGGVNTFVRTFTVTVDPTNDAPTLDAIGNVTVTEDAPEQTVNLAGISAGSGGESQVLTVTAVSDNPALIPNPTVTYASPNATGTLKFTPAANQSGTATITVTVSDDGGTGGGGVNTVVRTFTITVDPANDAPTLDPLSNRTIAVSAAGQTVNLAGISAGADETQVLTVTATSDNTDLIPDPTVTYTSANATGTLTFTPVAGQDGTATVTVTVTDDGGTANGGVNTVVRTFTITVVQPNQPPTLDAITDVTVAEDATEQTVNLTGISAGPANESGQSLTVTAVSDNPGLIPNPTVTYTSPNTTGTLTFTPAANQNGTATVTVTVTDDGGTVTGGVNTVVRTFTVTVNAVNDVPAVTGGPFAILQSIANGSAVGTVTATDVETHTPFTFAITGGNTGAAFAIDPATGQITVADGSAITDHYDLTVTATDSVGGVGTTTVEINLDFIPTTAGLPNESQDEDSGPFDVDLAAAFTDAETPDNLLAFAVVANSNPALFSAVTIAGTTLTLTPAPDASGVATLTVRATDEQGQSVETSFQVTVGEVNDGPVLNAAVKVALTAVPAKAMDPAGDLMSRLTANVTDADPGQTAGVAITGFTQGTKGVWQYSTDNGTNWLPIPTDVAADKALLLPATAKVRFLPAKTFQGFAFLSYKAWDQTTGTAATQADTTAGTAFSAAVETAVVAVGKTSPRIDAAGFPLLTSVAEDNKLPKGDAVAKLVGTLATDANARTKFGIAVTGLTGAGNGTWQYSLGGNKWSPVGTVGDAAALLLGPTNKLRFVPTADFNGSATVTYRAWDQTAGSAGAKVATTGSAFSISAETAKVNVTPVNDAPVLDLTRARTLPAVAGGATAGPVTVTSLLAGAVTDVDSTPAGIVVVGATGLGTWQYRSGAGAFTAVPKVSAAKGFLLAGADELQFVAAAGFTGTAALSYRAWDGSTGTAGQIVSTKGTAFSVGTEVLTVASGANVTADVTGGTATLPAVVEDTASPAGTPVGKLLAGVQPLGLKGIAITNATTTDGKWQYALTGKAWVDVGTATPDNAVLLSTAAKLRFVPNADFNGSATFQFRTWDRTTGQSGDRFDTTQTGLVSFGATTATATVPVTAVNDTPVLDTTPVKVLDPLTVAETTPVSVASLLGTAVTDADGTTTFGIAVTAATGPGTWQFSTGGGPFNPFPAVSATRPLFLLPTDEVKFVASGVGGASLSYKAWDQSTATGAVSAATETLSFAVGATTQPTIGTVTLTSIVEDPKAVAGDVVGTAFGGAIAVTGVTGTAGGQWQYSLSPNVWVNVGTVSDSAALVLPAAARVRFLPNANFNGAATVTAKAWDGFVGAAGEKVDTTLAALANSFSATAATGTVTIAAVNDAPVLDTTPAPALPDLPVNPTTNDGVTVADLLGGAATDVDGATLGIALVAAAGKGQWQFQLAGQTEWTTVKPSTSKAVLLDATARVRFVPAAGFVGKATLSFRAWEVTVAQVGTAAPVKGSAFSVATETATVSVGNAGPDLTTL